jgi:16S rRNA G527 N7-methylase RsmG
LGELLAAVIQSASEGLDLLMHNFVCANITTLRKRFTTDVALIRAFTSVASLVSLSIHVRNVSDEAVTGDVP